MSYDFYVIEGKKLINYKPTAEHYKRALARMIQNNLHHTLEKENMIKFIFLTTRLTGLLREENEKLTYDELEERLQFMFWITDLMGKLTPNEFMRLFPIPKEYDGEKYYLKDYFSTMEKVSKYPFDKPIGKDKITEFLMEYYNWDIIEFEVEKISIISDIRRMEGRKGVFEEFAEDQGIKLQTFHQEGDYMVDNDTGERFKIQKPKNNMRKLFSVVE